jgi:hypothetical protein
MTKSEKIVRYWQTRRAKELARLLLIVSEVAEETGVPLVEMATPSRKKKVLNARREVIRRAREAGILWTVIGDVLGRTYSVMRYHIDPDWRSRRMSSIRHYRKRKEAEKEVEAEC